VFRGVFVLQELEDAGNREEHFRKEVRRVPSPAHKAMIIWSPSVRRAERSQTSTPNSTMRTSLIGRMHAGPFAARRRPALISHRSSQGGLE